MPIAGGDRNCPDRQAGQSPGKDRVRRHRGHFPVGAFFYFSDDTFTANKRRVIEICRKIIDKKLDITWHAISRVDYVSEEVLYWMRKAGCIQISYGVESGSERIRKFLLKNISSEKIQSAFALTQKFGIMARAYFIYGAPQESRQTIQETIDLINTLKPLSAIFYILDILWRLCHN
jgi:anaerobic magnesium-protoporphyrin IX monomethyl ester cyclase